jgi:Flp pilus assembly pilin Flp
MILPSRSTRGQGTIDYVLIVVLLGLAAVFAFKLLGGSLRSRYDRATGAVARMGDDRPGSREQIDVTGRAAPSHEGAPAAGASATEATQADDDRTGFSLVNLAMVVLPLVGVFFLLRSRGRS